MLKTTDIQAASSAPWRICTQCGAKIDSITVMGRVFQPKCECEVTLYDQAQAEKRISDIEQKLKTAGFMTGRYADMRMEKWQSSKKLAYIEKAVHGYLDAVRSHGRNWLYLCGGFGTGKTHIAVAVARQLAYDNGWIPVICRWAEHCSTVQQSWNEHMATQWRDIHRAPLLVLDDIDKRASTEWAIGQLYELIEHRYVHMLPTLITANRKLSDLPAIWAHDMRIADVGKAIISRIIGQIQGQIEFKGDDFRFGR